MKELACILLCIAIPVGGFYCVKSWREFQAMKASEIEDAKHMKQITDDPKEKTPLQEKGLP